MMILQQLQPQLKQGRAKKRGRKTKARPIHQSKRAELQYTKELLDISAMCQKIGGKLLDALKNNQRFIGDAAIGDSAHWDNIIGGDVDMLFLRISGITGVIAAKVVQSQKEATDEQLAALIEQMTTVDIRAIMSNEALTDVVNDAIVSNVGLIKSIPEKYFSELERIVNTGFQDGWTYNQIQESILKLGQSTNSRARFIARDQIGKMNSRFNQARQTNLGIEEYEWSTSQDERVRGNPTGRYPRAKHNHYKRNGEVFKWNDPPPGGHPGQDYQCRCTPIPVLDHLLK